MLGFKPIKNLAWLIIFALSLTSLSWANTSSTPDVRLIIDISGSMKRTDPNNLRIPATNLLIDLLPENSQAGIWTFGAYVNMLVPHGEVTSNWRTSARRQANKINSVALFTDIENALERASWDIKSTSTTNDRHLILLSDGLVDISEASTAKARETENQKSRDFLLRQKVNELAKAGFTVHTLALSDEADLDLMATLAQRTGGLHAVAYKNTDLMPLLLQIINRLAPSDEVALDENKFLIDPSIEEFTLLAFHADQAEASLVSPSGKTFTATSKAANQRWHSTANYTLLTVSQPEAGNWQLLTPEHPDNRVTVVSDVRLEATKLPPTLFRGYPVELEAWLTESSQPIEKTDFLNLLQVTAKVNQGAQELLKSPLELQDKQHKFTLKVDELTQLGEQNFKIEVDGQTFNRQLNQSINVQDPLAASLQLPEDGSQPRIILRAQHPDLNPTSLSFLITANSTNSLTAEYRGDGEWKVDLGKLNRSQNQEISLLVKIHQEGEQLSLELPNLYLAALPHLAEAAQPAPIEPSIEKAEEESSIPALVEEQTLTQTAVEPEEVIDTQEEAPASAEAGWWQQILNLLTGKTEPIQSWQDSRMPIVYSALAVANLLVFLIAVIMYRRFLKKRSANPTSEKTSAKKSAKAAKKNKAVEEEPELAELDELDELDDEPELKTQA